MRNILLLFTIFVCVSTYSKNQEKSEQLFSVVNVVDGDTIDVKMDSGIKRIRIIGINTPETKDRRKPVECFGKEASIEAINLLAGQKVRLVSDPTQGDRDKYGRLLRYVFLSDGSNYSEKMISGGYGHEFTYRIPHKYQKDFKKAENEARDKKRGLWADDACINFKGKKKLGDIAKVKGNTNYTCDCSKTCPKMTCDEAYYQMEKCNWIPCETQCKEQER